MESRVGVLIVEGKPRVMISRPAKGGKKMIRPSRCSLGSNSSLFLFLSVIGICLFSETGNILAKDKDHPPYFLPEERRVIVEFYQESHKSGLPPGLAKRGGNLPPGLQKHLEKNGTLPPGLQKRVEPLPLELERRLPRIPEIWERVIIGQQIVLLDRRTKRILDIVENVIGLATDR